MTILVTVFLVLVNIFNNITSKIPKADGLTAIEAFIIVCIIFVFGALIGRTLFLFNITLSQEYAFILLALKLKTSAPPDFKKTERFSDVNEVVDNFKKIDIDGDGKLTKRELLAGNQFTMEEIETIFDVGDVDGDGTIDMGEFVGLMFPEAKASQRTGRPKVTILKKNFKSWMKTGRKTRGSAHGSNLPTPTASSMCSMICQ